MATGSININVDNTLDIREINSKLGTDVNNETVMDKLNTLIGSGDSGTRSAYVNSHCSQYVEDYNDLPYSFRDGSAVVYNNEIHILGNSYSSYFTYHYKWNGSSWSSVSTLPYQFRDGSAVVYNNEIHILGNSYSSYFTSHYKWNGSSWSSVSTLPYIFYNGSAVVYNNEIHILGSGNNSYNTCHYKWNGSSWCKINDTPYNFYAGSAVIYDNEIHILGSSNYSTYHAVFSYGDWCTVHIPQSTLSLFEPCTIYTTGRSRCINRINNREGLIPTVSGNINAFEITEPGAYTIYTRYPYLVKL